MFMVSCGCSPEHPNMTRIEGLAPEENWDPLHCYMLRRHSRSAINSLLHATVHAAMNSWPSQPSCLVQAKPRALWRSNSGACPEYCSGISIFQRISVWIILVECEQKARSWRFTHLNLLRGQTSLMLSQPNTWQQLHNSLLISSPLRRKNNGLFASEWARSTACPIWFKILQCDTCDNSMRTGRIHLYLGNWKHAAATGF